MSDRQTGHTLPHDKRRDVVRRELAWHDQKAQNRRTVDGLLYRPPAFDRLVRTELDFLAPTPGERVLDMGSGEGKETLELARRGACVISADLSLAQLRRARALLAAREPSAHIHFVQANAEELPFAAGSFRKIYGKAIVHHLDAGRVASEVRRLLAPAGRATFAEPLAHHPLFWLARRLTPALRTRDERPLAHAALRRFAASFAASHVDQAFLLAPLAFFLRLLPGGEPVFLRVYRFLQDVDAWLFRVLPPLRRFAWYGTVRIS